MFLMTEPDQYLYNRAFHFKLLFIALAGLNVAVFYLAVFRRVSGLAPGVDAPHAVKVFGATSLICWIAVIVCGRLITWYRPDLCDPGEAIGFLADCIPGNAGRLACDTPGSQGFQPAKGDENHSGGIIFDPGIPWRRVARCARLLPTGPRSGE